MRGLDYIALKFANEVNYKSDINIYSKSLSWAENLNFPPKTVNSLFKFSAQNSDLEYLFWKCKKFPVSSDLKPPLGWKCF